MTIDWNAFTPWRSLAGGLLIGLAAALLMWGSGRIAGVSGILGGLLQHAGRTDPGWRVAFLVGLVVAPLVHALAAPVPVPHIDAPAWLLAGSGVLVGLGTRYAGGCTSGHGVCGLSRLSAPSLAATLAFMGAGFATVALMRHGLP